ncbi:MAG: HIT domain-containing protein [Planctomycetia bacterium]|nr:HIT domain-containing protein [Planctomycetia bacterium]
MSYSEIWAPWRMAYIQQDKEEEISQKKLIFSPDADPTCFICQAAADTPENDSQRYVIYRGETALVIMNRFPYNNGHLLITPRRHISRLDLLTPEEHLELMDLLAKMIKILEETIHPEGFNAGLNLGHVAGAGLPGHLHWHLVPRWNGDTNFMPILASVNVIPQSLDSLWKLLYDKINNAE